VSQADEEARRRAERARQVGLLRYRLVSEVTGPQLSARQRGQRVRELAAAEHDGPGGGKVRVSEQTIRRWVRQWRAGGFEALVPAPARVSPRTPAEVLALAVALKRENPQRTAVQITRILRAQAGWAPSDRTLQRHFVRLELDRELEGKPQVFGRFEADRCNEMWTGDALHGPVIGGRKTYLSVTWNHHGVAPCECRGCPVASLRAGGDGGPAGDGCGDVWQVAGSGAARAGC
jgi:putative transposase